MRKFILISLLAFMFLILVPHASASDNPIIKIYDSTFTTETDYFTTCPVTVGIKTYSAVGSYDVLLVEPDGVTTHTLAAGVAAGVWHSFTPTCDKIGWWTVKAGSINIPFSIGTFYVIPEVPLGVATTLGACFAGIFARQLRRTKKKTP